MSLIDVMKNRRSVREYTDEDIPEEKLERIIQAGLLAPTSRNRKPCKFIVVRDKETLNKLSKSKRTGSKMLKGANVAIVVCADADKADTWVEDSSIALSYMNLMAEEQGIGSCWVQIHLRKTGINRSSEDYVRELFNLDEKCRIVGILSLGMPDKKPDGHDLSDLDYDKVEYV
ncbi:nitroreductase family protein [Methanobrevibacter boviskoreani]|uniref:nitroreductase family protein n=1 Tax=Methanobrevibacter boviskoreani TaxID=1348249 RepID=UPI0023F03A6B|nr:nitroreductase family protein [Methanobrevibacter boviskoreani]MDD6257256.1 nitroreductase family protein [Methanobrevibacter boviskoreani]